MVNLKKRDYVRSDEKTDIMKLASLQKVVKLMIPKYEKAKDANKDILTNMKYATTYTRKALEGIFDGVDPYVLDDIKTFVERKEVMVTDPKDARIVREYRDKEQKNIDVPASDFDQLCKDLKEDICQHCEGEYSDCIYRKIMMLHDVDGISRYVNCPFSGAEQVMEQQEINL